MPRIAVQGLAQNKLFQRGVCGHITSAKHVCPIINRPEDARPPAYITCAATPACHLKGLDHPNTTTTPPAPRPPSSPAHGSFYISGERGIQIVPGDNQCMTEH